MDVNINNVMLTSGHFDHYIVITVQKLSFLIIIHLSAPVNIITSLNNSYMHIQCYMTSTGKLIIIVLSLASYPYSL